MSAKAKLILDIIIFTTFMTVTSPSLTGMAVHEWLALAFATAGLTHLLFHWNWLATMTKHFSKKHFQQSRLNYVVDTLFFIAMTTSLFSGVLISKSVIATLGIQLNVSQGWKFIHKLASDASLIMLGLHFALHLRWVHTNLKWYLALFVVRLLQRSRAGALAMQPHK